MAALANPAQTEVRVAGFVLDRDEVTVSRFRQYWNASPVPHPGVASGAVPYRGPQGTIQLVWDGPVQSETDLRCGGTFGMAGREGHPITCVDWATAQAFCVWDGGRLPTEAEWELAARSTDGRLFPWGNQNDVRRSCTRPAVDTTCAVDDPAYAMGASAQGVRHLLGNAWEWTADFYSNYILTGPASACGNRSGLSNPLCTASTPEQRGTRSTRGASYGEGDNNQHRSAGRDAQAPNRYAPFLGFRCARDSRGS